MKNYNFNRKPGTRASLPGRIAPLMVAIGLLGLSNASAAGTVFNIGGSLTNGSLFSGTLTIDTTTPNSMTAIQAANIIIGPPSSETCNGSINFQGAAGAAGYFVNINCTPANTLMLVLNTPSSSGGFLTGYTGGTINTSSATDSFLGNTDVNVPVSSATVSQTAPPSISKTFSPTEFSPGGTSTLSLNITNPNGATVLTGVAFTDTLPPGMTIAASTGLTSNCSGTATANAGSGAVTLSGGSIPGGGSCSVSVNVTAPEGFYDNFVQVTSANGGSGNTAIASAIAAFGPALTKAFGAVSIAPLGSTSLTFSMTNPNQTLALSEIQFSDTLPAGLIVSTPNALTGSCGGAVITATAGSNLIWFGGASLAPLASCTFSLNVSSDGTVTGLLVNTTTPVSSIVGTIEGCGFATSGGFARTTNRSIACSSVGIGGSDPTGPPATAHLFIGAPFLVNYSANLNLGESYVNIGNAGTNGAPLLGPGLGGAAGNICVNVYAFDPSEELISCCSCLVTPGQTVNLGVNASLTSKTLTGVQPTSVTIKLLSTLAGGTGTATTCNNSAATAAGTLANGATAFRTTLHATPVSGSYATTETQFTPATLSQGELNSITGRCASIIGNASGFGICNSCRAGALGGSKL